MKTIDYSTGPFGRYERESPGHVLNTLCHMGIPVSTVERCIAATGVVALDGAHYGTYKYLDGIEQPLFRFADTDMYPGLVIKLDLQKVSSTPEFRLSLSIHNTAGIIVSGQNATKYVHLAIMRSLTNIMAMPSYEIHKDAGAFFQGGSNDPDGGWFYVELWKAAGAQAYADHLSNLYKEIIEENFLRKTL